MTLSSLNFSLEETKAMEEIFYYFLFIIIPDGSGVSVLNPPSLGQF